MLFPGSLSIDMNAQEFSCIYSLYVCIIDSKFNIVYIFIPRWENYVVSFRTFRDNLLHRDNSWTLVNSSLITAAIVCRFFPVKTYQCHSQTIWTCRPLILLTNYWCISRKVIDLVYTPVGHHNWFSLFLTCCLYMLTTVSCCTNNFQTFIAWYYVCHKKFFCNNVIWSTVSKAFEKSRKIPITQSPFSNASDILAINMTKAMWVDLPIWNPNRYFYYKSLSLMNFKSRFYMSLSMIFEKMGSTDTGLIWSSDLKMGTILAIINASGNIPVLKDKL